MRVILKLIGSTLLLERRKVDTEEGNSLYLSEVRTVTPSLSTIGFIHDIMYH